MTVTCRVDKCPFYDNSLCRNQTILITPNGICAEIVRGFPSNLNDELFKENFAVMDVDPDVHDTEDLAEEGENDNGETK